MTDAETDRTMCTVLFDAIVLNEKNAVDPDAVFQPSRRHCAQMQRMLKKPLHWARNRSRGDIEKTVRCAAVILILLSISFSLVMLFSAPTRAVFGRWIVERYQSHIVYRYFGKAKSLPRYELTGLPNGFVELERMETPTFTDVIYENDDSELISFSYTLITQGSATGFVPNEDVVSEVMVGKHQGMLFIPRDPGSMITLTWIDEEAGVQFTITAALDVPDVIRLAESQRSEKKK